MRFVFGWRSGGACRNEAEKRCLNELGVMSKPGAYSRKPLSSKEWHKELLLSWLFRTCFKLQTSLDRRFLDFGMTFQEAAVLMRCVEGGETVPSRLALTLGRDKGNMTRLVDRLELVKRLISPRDRRYSVIKATPEGKRLAGRMASTFEHIREELFIGVLDRDIQRLSVTLPRLHRNAVGIGSKRSVSSGRRRPRIGEKKDHLQKVETVRVEETCRATEVSSATTESQNGNGCEQNDERLVRADCKTVVSEPEEAVTPLTEVMPSRLAT